MTFKSLSQPRVRLADKVYEQIMSAILDGTISPNDRIIQEKLAEEFDISRTPIREALFRMEQEGILRVAKRGGFVIRMPGPDEIENLYDARAAIEGCAARMLAIAKDPKTIAHLRALIAKEEDLKDRSVQTYFMANRNIHRSFVEATKNGIMLDFFDTIWSRATSFTLFASISADSLADSLGDHMNLVDVIETGDGPRAAEAMIAHIQNGLELQRSS